MLGGMLSPDSGQVRCDGASLYDLSVADRRQAAAERIGFVFQTFNLVPYLTALENVQVPLYLLGQRRKPPLARKPPRCSNRSVLPNGSTTNRAS